MDKILIVEDSPLAQSLLSEILFTDYELVFQNDGLSGLAAAQTIHPDLIILDILIPGIDGYEVCRVLKENDKTREIPVIFMTSLGSETERVRGFETGANDYIVKPFYKQEMLARVRAQLAFRKAKEQALSLERLTLFQELAVAISHEINNPLTSIFAFLHFLQEELADAPSSTMTALDGIKKEISRIQQIVSKLPVAAKAQKVRYNQEISMIDLHNL